MVQALDVAYLSIAELGRLFRSHELSPVEVTEQLLARAESLQDEIHAFITITPDIALAQARAAEAAFLQGGEVSPLLGIPIGYKDIVTTKGVLTTCGSALHLNWIPDSDAAVVDLWQSQGTVMLGKLTTWEFASGAQPLDHAITAARNPWNPVYSPAGSSSGSGAALAAGILAGAIGTDTGGSIRGPAAYCGITGLKPTYGRVSRRGIVTMSWSLDHAGPMARTAEDVAYLFNPLAAYDPSDPASASVPTEDYLAAIYTGVEGLYIGLPINVLELADENVRAATEAAADVFRSLGATVVPVTYPDLELTRAMRPIGTTESYSYHATDLLESPKKYGAPLEANLKTGGLYFASEYIEAQRARAIVRDAVKAMFDGLDMLLCPTMPTEPPTYEESLKASWGRRPGITNLFNQTGQPALAFPSGFSETGLPLSVQLVGRPFDESSLLAGAHAYQSVTDWHMRHPKI